MINLSKYGFYRICTASPEVKVADISFNLSKIIETVLEVEKRKCSLVIFPELSLTSFSCGDLFYQKILLDESVNALEKLTVFSLNTQLVIVVGAPIFNKGKLYNCGIVISNGEIKGIVPKSYIPNTNEYYEERWFSSANDNDDDFIELAGKLIPFGNDLIFKDEINSELLIGIEICEDLWAVNPPSSNLALAGANLILNLSASSEYLGKADYRKKLVISQSGRCIAAYAYSGSGPGESTTDVVFSGHSIIAENGILLTESERFNFSSQITIADIDIQRVNHDRIKNNTFGGSYSNQFRIIDLPVPELFDTNIERKINSTPFIPLDKDSRADTCKEIFNIQTTGLSKRLKHTGLKNVVIGISGGLDSTLALLVILKAYEKLGLDKSGIHSIAMPGFGTSSRTKSNSILLARNLGLEPKIIDIKKAVEHHFKDISHQIENHDVVFENSQARERTQILMDIANMVNGLVIGTGDLSEMALGWSTYNGDHMSMYGVNAGVPKTLVKYIIEWCSDEIFDVETSEILRDIIDTPISPELIPPDVNGKIVQETEVEIGPYLLNDFFLYYSVRFGFNPAKIYYLATIAFAEKFDKVLIKKYLIEFYQRFFSNQFKRSCLPDSIKVGSVSLSPRGDWRMPSDAVSVLWLKELLNITEVI